MRLIRARSKTSAKGGGAVGGELVLLLLGGDAGEQEKNGQVPVLQYR